MRFKSLVIRTALSMVAAAASAAPARADIGDLHVKCDLDSSLKADFPLSGGKGTYRFSQIGIACVGVEKGVSPVGFVLQDVESTGTWKNTICGGVLAKATSDDVGGFSVGSVSYLPPPLNLVKPLPTTDVESLFESLKYEIQFSGNHGQLFWHGPWGKVAAPKVTPDVLNPKPQDPPKAAYYGGTIQLTDDRSDKRVGPLAIRYRTSASKRCT